MHLSNEGAGRLAVQMAHGVDIGTADKSAIAGSSHYQSAQRWVCDCLINGRNKRIHRLRIQCVCLVRAIDRYRRYHGWSAQARRLASGCLLIQLYQRSRRLTF